MSKRFLGAVWLAASLSGCAVCDCMADLVQVTVLDGDGAATTWTSFTVHDAEGAEVAADTCEAGRSCAVAFVPMDGPEGTYTVQIDGEAGSATFDVDLDRPRKVVGQCCSDVFSLTRSVTLTPAE